MDKLIKDIAELANRIDLSKRFVWNDWETDFKNSELFSTDEKKEVLEQQNGFDKNVALKKVLHQPLSFNEIVDLIPINKKDLLNMLQLLIEKDNIILNLQNKFQLKR